jgi:hypothetical protein
MRNDSLERECFTCTAEPKPRCRTCHAALLARLQGSQQATAEVLAELREAQAACTIWRSWATLLETNMQVAGHGFMVPAYPDELLAVIKEGDNAKVG